MDVPEKVKKKLRELPDGPGCYIMRDRRGRIIYVGKAASLRKRVQSYFRQATLRGADPKLRGLIRSVHDLEILTARTEAEALLTESRLIKDYKPRYNVDWRDDKRFLLLRGDSAAPLPQLKVCRIHRNDDAVYFGPFPSSAATRATLDFVEKRFGLRKCSPRIPNGETYRHCLNDIVRYCSAPCIGKVSPEQYRERFEEALSFLRGEQPRLLEKIREDMEAAARALDFERARALRDTLLSLRAVVRQKARVVTPPEIKRAEAQEGVRELGKALGLRNPPRTIEAYDISNISGTFAVASMVYFVDGLPQRRRYRRFRIRTVAGSDDPAMMAEVIARRFLRLQEEGGNMPDLALVDGGITQVRAARGVLTRLGISGVPVAGLAKRHEELFWREGRRPLRLPASSRALLVLQRVRDEAHRFAITYHRHLRRRRIRESVLDEIPGIGKKRKELLLRHFGSVRRLAAAAPEAIAAVPGIGPQMAELVAEALRG